MIRLRGLVGRPVVARDTAETLGQVQGAIVDTRSGQVLGLQVGRGRKATVVDWSEITGVGPDAAVVRSESSLRAPEGEREERIVKGDVPLLGARVLSDSGDELGSLDDVEFDESSGEVHAVVAGPEAIPVDRLRSIGSYAVVVAAAPADLPAPAPEDGPASGG